MHVVLWNGFKGKLEVFRGTDHALDELASIHLEEGNDVIYFYAEIDTITLKEEEE